MAKLIKRRRGRPPLPEHQRKGRILKFRARGDLVSRMQAAATATGRSVSEEIEYRLERSFQNVDELADLKETVTAVFSNLGNTIEGLKQEAEGLRRLGEALREEARVQTSSATNEETKSQEADVVSLMDRLREQLLREQLLREQARKQASVATNKETKNRTGTGDKS